MPSLLLTILATAAASALAETGTWTPPAADYHGASIASVRFAGVSALEPELIQDAIETRPGRCRSPLLLPVCALSRASWAEEPSFLDTLAVRRDERRIAELYAAWGYPDASARAQVVPLRSGEVVVWFHVHEGEPIIVGSLEIRGLEALPAPPRLPQLPLRVGDVYALPRLEAAQRRIAEALGRLGYAFAEVEVAGDVSAERRVAELVLVIRPGPRATFGPTVIHPEPPLDAATVRSRLAYRGGDRFSSDALERTAERLYRLPIVERVFIDPLRAATPDSVVVTTIGVTTGRVQGLGLSGTISSSRCVQGALSWAHRHLLGAPRRLTLRGGGANLFTGPLRGFPCSGVGEEEFSRPDYVAQAELLELVGPDTWLQLAGSVSRETAPRAFIRRGWAARVGVGHALSREVDALLAYAPERRDDPAARPILCALYDACTAPQLDALTGMAMLAPAEVNVAWVSRAARLPLPPRPGPAWLHPPLPPWAFTLRGELAAAGPPTGSDFSFGSLTLDATLRRRLTKRLELAGRVHGAHLWGAEAPLPPQVRLYGGGPLGVRGVAANLLGAKLLSIPAADTAGLGCEPPPGGCAGVRIDPGLVRLRPLGGELLGEVNVEARAWVGRAVQLAAFLDLGWLRTGAVPDAPAALVPSEGVLTPGLGVLALTPFGAVRADVAYDPSSPRRYPLLLREADGREFVFLGDAVFDRYGFGDPSPLVEIWRRLQFQLSMGQPF